MRDSGSVFEWNSTSKYVDKHSTGGVGDKVSIPLAPALAACGLRVPMISGRGLGPTGGTLDKLESIKGFDCGLTSGQFTEIVERVGCVISGATTQIAPADQKLYALRDVTATIPSIPLITASILSKKLAESLDALVLDVKWGSGAFMKTHEDAKALAISLVRVAHQLGTRTTAILTNMNRPLGQFIGNSVEIFESLNILRGEGPDDVRTLVCVLGGQLLVDTGISDSAEQGQQRIAESLDNGTALAKFEEMVVAQGGDLSVIATPAHATFICFADCRFDHSNRR